MTRTYRQPGELAVLVAAAAIGLAACGGASASSPHVASLGHRSGSGSASPAAAPPKGSNPTQLLDEWAACMRRHGDPNQTDPTIDASKEIHIFMRNVSGAQSAEVHGGTGPCSNYELAAQKALRGGEPAPKQVDMATAVKYAECIRAHGVPNYPNPDPANPDETNFTGSGVNPSSPAVVKAGQVCAKKTGMPAGGSPADQAGVVIVRALIG